MEDGKNTNTIDVLDENLSLELFKLKCNKLSTELYDTEDLIEKVEVLANTMKWFASQLASIQSDTTIQMNDHQIYFITTVLPKCIEALMKREYTNKEHHPIVVNAFFKSVLSLLAKHAIHFPKNVPITKPLLSSILSPTKFNFYCNYGVIKPGNDLLVNDNDPKEKVPISVVDELDDEVAGEDLWKLVLAVGDSCDFVDGGRVLSAKVKSISPYNTEMELIFFSGDRPCEWVTKTDSRVYKVGTGETGLRHSDKVTVKGISNEETEPLEDWRVELQVDSPVDFKDSSGIWFQGIVVEIEEPLLNGDEKLLNTPVCGNKTKVCPDAQERTQKGETEKRAKNKDNDSVTGGTFLTNNTERKRGESVYRGLKIHYVGFGTALDEWVQRNSQRLLELNARSRGRRGTAKKDLDEFDFMMCRKQQQLQQQEEREGELNIKEYDQLNHFSCSQSFLSQSKYLVENLQHFGQCKGYLTILQMLERTNEHGSSFYSHADVRTLLQTLADNHVHYSNQFLHYYGAELAPKVFTYIQKLEKVQLRDFNKYIFQSFRGELIRLLKRCYSDEHIGSVMEPLMLNVALHFLQLDMLNRRLDGLRLLSECKQMIIARQYQQTHSEQSKWLDSDKFIHWLNENDVMNILFQNGRLHVQILKETTQLLGFLAKEDALSSDLVDTLWDLKLSNDSEIKKTAYGVFQALSLQVRQSSYVTILKRLLSSTRNVVNSTCDFSVTKDDVEMLWAFARWQPRATEPSSVSDDVDDTDQNSGEHFPLRALQRLWEMSLDGSSLDTNVAAHAGERLCQILQSVKDVHPCRLSQRDYFWNICVSFVQRGCEEKKGDSSIPQALDVLACIANSAPPTRSDGRNPAKYTESLMEHVFVELFRYRESTNWSNTQPVHILRFSYIEQINKRLTFLRDMTVNEPHLKLLWRHIESICKEIINTTHVQEERDLCYNWIQSCVTQSSSLADKGKREGSDGNENKKGTVTIVEQNVIFDDHVETKLLDHHFSRLSVWKTLDVSGLRCYWSLFCSVNTRLNNIIIDEATKRFELKNPNELVGSSLLSGIVLECKNEKVANEAITYLKNLLQHPDLCTQHVRSVMKALSLDDGSKVRRLVSLLTVAFGIQREVNEKEKEKKVKEGDKPPSSSDITFGIVNSVKDHPRFHEKNLEMTFKTSHKTKLMFMRIAAKLKNLSSTKIRIFCSGKEIKSSSSTTIADLNISTVVRPVLMITGNVITPEISSVANQVDGEIEGDTNDKKDTNYVENFHEHIKREKRVKKVNFMAESKLLKHLNVTTFSTPKPVDLVPDSSVSSFDQAKQLLFLLFSVKNLKKVETVDTMDIEMEDVISVADEKEAIFRSLGDTHAFDSSSLLLIDDYNVLLGALKISSDWEIIVDVWSMLMKSAPNPSFVYIFQSLASNNLVGNNSTTSSSSESLKLLFPGIAGADCMKTAYSLTMFSVVLDACDANNQQALTSMKNFVQSGGFILLTVYLQSLNNKKLAVAPRHIKRLTVMLMSAIRRIRSLPIENVTTDGVSLVIDMLHVPIHMCGNATALDDISIIVGGDEILISTENALSYFLLFVSNSSRNLSELLQEERLFFIIRDLLLFHINCSNKEDAKVCQKVRILALQACLSLVKVKQQEKDTINEHNIQADPSIILAKLLSMEMNFVRDIPYSQNRCGAYFTLLVKCLDVNPLAWLALKENNSLSLNILTKHIEHMITSNDQQFIEKYGENSSERNNFLHGVLSLIHNNLMVQKNQAKICHSTHIVNILLGPCLFDIAPSLGGDLSNSEKAPLCREKNSRDVGLRALYLGAQNVGMLDTVRERMISVVGICDMSELKYWNNNPEDQAISSTGYVGLNNLGCTCYQNCLMQQMRFLPGFANGILAAQNDELENIRLWNTKKDSDNENSDQKKDEVQEKEQVEKQTDNKKNDDYLLFQLQRMIAHLTHSKEKAYHPKDWCYSFKDEFGLPTAPGIQQDAQEYFGKLCDRLESQLKTCSPKNLRQKLFEDTFKGLYAEQLLKKSGGKLRDDLKTPFYSVSLDVSKDGDGSLSKSLMKMCRGEVMSDFKVEGKLCEVIKRQLISVVPKACIFHLKRFELNYNTFTQEKINSRFQFPKRIDLKPYTVDAIKHVENNVKKDRKKESLQEEWYQLQGVVVHSGTANYGHYYSYIKVNNNWLEFNDATVKPFNVENLDAECFGGKALKSVFNAQLKKMIYSEQDITNNAYMLVYIREDKNEEEQKKEEKPTLGHAANVPRCYSASGVDLVKNVKKQNFRFLNRRVALTTSFLNIARQIVYSEFTRLSTSSISPDLIPSVKFGTLCALLVSSRIEDITPSVNFIELMETFIYNDSSTISNQVAMDILCINYRETIRFVVLCHKELVRKAFSNFIVTVAVIHFEQSIEQQEQKQNNFHLLENLTSVFSFDFVIKNWGKVQNYLEIMLNIAKRSTKAQQYMLSVGYLGKIVDLMLNSTSPIREALTSNENDKKGWWNKERLKKTEIHKKKSLQKKWKKGAELILLLIQSTKDLQKVEDFSNCNVSPFTLDPASLACVYSIPLYKTIMNGLDKKKVPMVDASLIAKTLAIVGVNQLDFVEKCSAMICTLFDQSNHERIVHVGPLVQSWVGIEDNYSRERRRRLLFGDGASSDGNEQTKPSNEGLFDIIHRYPTQRKFSRIALNIILEVVKNDPDLIECIRNRWNTSLSWILPLLNEILREAEKSATATIAIALAAMMASGTAVDTTVETKSTAETTTFSEDTTTKGISDSIGDNVDDELTRAIALSLASVNSGVTLALSEPQEKVQPTNMGEIEKIKRSILDWKKIGES